MAPIDLAQRQEDAVEAHDRAAVHGVAFGDAGQQPEGCWRGAGDQEDAGGEAGHEGRVQQ